MCRHHNSTRGSTHTLRRIAQRPNVIDDVCPRIQCSLHDFGLVRVNRNGHTQFDRFSQHGHQALQLLLQRQRLRTRSGGLRTQIQYVGSLRQQLLAMCKRQCNVIETATI
jgi:hypothetical protein